MYVCSSTELCAKVNIKQVFVSPGSKDRWIRVPFNKNGPDGAPLDTEKDEPLDPKSLPEGDPPIEIESLIIPAVQELHTKYIQSYGEKKEQA